MQSEEIRVLLVDDDQGDFEMIRVMLAQSAAGEFRVDWVATFEEAQDAFEQNEHDVYFLDYFLEDRSGLGLLKEAEQRGVSAPIIMLTGRGSGVVEMEAMEAGATDYLVKGTFGPEELGQAVREALGLGDPTPSGGGPEEESETGRGAEGSWGSGARFRAAFENTRSGMALVNLDGSLQEVNPALAEALSASPRWAEGLAFTDLLEPSHQNPFSMELETLSRGDQSRLESDHRYVGKDGDVFSARTITVLIRTPDGSPDHVLIMVEF